MSHACTKCGAAVEPRMLATGACAYCGAALAHLVEAARKAEVVRALLNDGNGNGVPDVLEGFVRQGYVPTRQPRPKPWPWLAYVAIVGGLVMVTALALATIELQRAW